MAIINQRKVRNPVNVSIGIAIRQRSIISTKYSEMVTKLVKGKRLRSL